MIEQLQLFWQQLTVLLESWGYLGLFTGSFIAASAIPFPGELLYIFCVSKLSAPLCVIVATLGNTLGAVTLYLMGMLCNLEWLCKHTRINYNRVRRIRYWLRHKGAPIAFLAFLPGLGQCIVLALGVIRCNLPKVTLFMMVGKCARYMVVAWITRSLM